MCPLGNQQRGASTHYWILLRREQNEDLSPYFEVILGKLRADSGEIMKCLIAIVFISIVLVEYIHAKPNMFWKERARGNLEPALRRDNAFDLNDIIDEQKAYKRFERFCKNARGTCWTDKDCCGDLTCKWECAACGDGACE
ncbi:hypothetical protein ACROYT_G026639 [Oculina patagonica]